MSRLFTIPNLTDAMGLRIVEVIQRDVVWAVLYDKEGREHDRESVTPCPGGVEVRRLLVRYTTYFDRIDWIDAGGEVLARTGSEIFGYQPGARYPLTACQEIDARLVVS